MRFLMCKSSAPAGSTVNIANPMESAESGDPCRGKSREESLALAPRDPSPRVAAFRLGKLSKMQARGFGHRGGIGRGRGSSGREDRVNVRKMGPRSITVQQTQARPDFAAGSPRRRALEVFSGSRRRNARHRSARGCCGPGRSQSFAADTRTESQRRRF